MASSGLQVLNGVTPAAGTSCAPGLAFAAHERATLDVHRPRRRGRPAAVVVFFHGGSWQNGDKDEYAFAGRALASRGLVAVVPNYRVWPPARFPAFLEDAAAAVRWARAHAAEHGGDAERLFVMGHSAGAHIALMLALDERWLARAGLGREALRGAIGLAGPYDFLPLRDADLREVFAAASPIEETQPIRFVDGAAPPLLLLHGSRDAKVGPGNTARLAARVRQAGGAVEEIHYAGIGHGGLLAALTPPLRFWVPVLRDVCRFVSQR